MDSDELIGNIALTEVLRGPLQSCYIGYSLDMQHNGKGYMTEAVKLVVWQDHQVLAIITDDVCKA